MKKLLLQIIILALPFLAFGQCPVPSFVVSPIGTSHFNITSPNVPGVVINWGPSSFVTGTGVVGGTLTVIDSNLICQFQLASCAYSQVRVARICAPGDTSAFSAFKLLPNNSTATMLPPFGPQIEIAQTAGTGNYAIPECYVPQHDTLPSGVIQHWQYGNMGAAGLPPLPNRPFFANNDSALYVNGLTQTSTITLETPYYFFGMNFNFDAEARFSIFNEQITGQTPASILIEATQLLSNVVDTLLYIDTITTAWLDVNYSFANKGFLPGNSIGLKVTADFGNVTSPSTNTIWLTPFRLGHPNSFTCNNTISVLEHDRDSITSGQLVVSLSKGMHSFSTPSDVIIEYGTVGFTPKTGNGTLLSNPFPTIPINQSVVVDTFRLTNLLPNMAYEAYIYDTCVNVGVGMMQGPFLISSTPDTIIQGKVVFDDQQSCSPQLAGIAFQQLLLLPDSVYTVTNQNGIFEFRPTSSGPWQVELLPDNRAGGFVRTACSPSATMAIPLVANTNLYTNVNFFLDNPAPLLLVNQVLMNLLVYNQGFTHTLAMHFTNFTNSTITDLSFSLSSDSVEFPSAVAPFITFMTNDSVHFSFTNLFIPVGGSFMAQKSVKTNVNNTTVGQYLPTTVTIHQPTGLGTINFTDSFVVVAAYDPNDKMVTPGGDIFTTPDELEYRIRFQNTGNFFATNVVITDTLPAEIELEDLQVQASSHNFRLERKGNVANFIFDNIFLPDSASDPDGSIGYLIFKAPLKTPMVLGDSISNRAYIYFDFQSPIITNDAYVKVVPNTVSVRNPMLEQSLKVFPNPSKNEFNIELPMQKPGEVRLRVVNAAGQVVLVDFTPNSGGVFQKTINLEAFGKGVYLLQIQTEKGILTRRLSLL